MSPMDPDAARGIGLVVFDVDGVLTDGGIYWTDPVDGEARGLRRFDVRDGLGIHMLHRADVPVAMVSGKESPAVRARARELRIAEVHQVPPARKVKVVHGLLEDRGLGWPDAACLGDDLPDLALLRRVGFPAAVADAAPEVAEVARWQSSRPGGRGAVREFAEALLRERGVWRDLVEAYLAESRVESGDERPPLE